MKDQRQNFEEELDSGDAYRDPAREHKPMNWEPVHDALKDVLRDLNEMTKTRIKHFYPQQYEEVMKILRKAVNTKEPSSLILMARSKMTNSTMLLQVENDIRSQMNDDSNLLVLKVNSILCNSENKLLAKFMYALGLKNVKKGETTSIEMYAKVREYFAENPNLTVLFIFEDIDHYVETTKQHMLYSLLNLLAECFIPVVFLSSSMKFDVIDNFEKRIKSRCSHRTALLYD